MGILCKQFANNISTFKIFVQYVHITPSCPGLPRSCLERVNVGRGLALAKVSGQGGMRLWLKSWGQGGLRQWLKSLGQLGAIDKRHKNFGAIQVNFFQLFCQLYLLLFMFVLICEFVSCSLVNFLSFLLHCSQSGCKGVKIQFQYVSWIRILVRNEKELLE